MIRAIPIIAAKDLVLLLRDRTALFWIFVLPVLVAIPLGAIFGGGLHALAPLAVQVLDQDDTAASRAFLTSLETTSALKLSRATSVDAGDAEVRARRAASVLVLRPGLERALSARGPMADAPEGAPIELRADPARKAEIAMLRGLVAEAAVANLVLPQPMELLPSLRAAAGVPGLPQVQVVPLADALVLPPTPYARSFPAGMGWAVIGATAVFALALAREGWGRPGCAWARRQSAWPGWRWARRWPALSPSRPRCCCCWHWARSSSACGPAAAARSPSPSPPRWRRRSA